MVKTSKHNHPIHTKEEHIKGLLEQVSAYIEQYHGGSVEFISLNEDVLTVRVGGACLGCSRLSETLQGWVAGTIRQFFPEIQIISAD